MKKISKAQDATRMDLVMRFMDVSGDLEKAVSDYNATRAELWDAVSTAIEIYNDGMEEAWSALEAPLEAYNGAIADANALRQEIVGEIEEYIGARSEKWQESDKASQYEDWKSDLSDEFSEVELEKPDPIEMDEPDELDISDIENHQGLMEDMRTELEAL